MIQIQFGDQYQYSISNYYNKVIHVQRVTKLLLQIYNIVQILMTAVELSATLEPKPTGTITDFKYSPTGQYLAIADSEGYVQIYTKKDGKAFYKTSEFRADEGSIWSIAWADIRYGNLIGIGSFRNKVAIFQQNNNVWKEIAYHDLHQASVNWIEFAPYGLKLFAGSSDGHISILQLYHKAWKFHSFSVSDSAVASFALQPSPLGQIVADQNLQKMYPRIATVTKDQKIKIWAHESEKLYSQSQAAFEQKNKKNTESGYTLVKQFSTPKQTIRNILWRPSWGSFSQALKQVRLLTCSQQGFVKQISFPLNEKQNVQIILRCENQITRISQSLTGNLLTASVVSKNQHETIVYEEVNDEEWKIIKKGKL